MVKHHDPRITPARGDIAAFHLFGEVEAHRYVNGTAKRVIWPNIAIRKSPSPRSVMVTEALFGQTIMVYHEEGGWGWGQLESDSYVGYFDLNSVSDAYPPERLEGDDKWQKITVLRTFVYPEPNIKTPPLTALPLGARFLAHAYNEQFVAPADGGFVFARHIAPLRRKEDDFIHVAEAFIGLPYLWGGKTALGIDCSGLVQIALDAIGVPAPRDSDMQQAELGNDVPLNILTLGAFETSTNAHKLAPLPDLKRGDLIFWQGHVGIMRDSKHMLHANGHHMLVASELLSEARMRIHKQTGHDVKAVRRLERLVSKDVVLK